VTEFLQLVIKGLALGSAYGLVALGFVVVFKATGVVNFTQGSFLLAGAYLTFTASVRWGLPFPLGVVAAAAGAVALALVVERVVVRQLAGGPPVTVLLATLGVALVLDQVVTLVWGFRPHHIGDPWGARSLRWAGLALSQVDVATLGLAAGSFAALAFFFRRTRLGLGLRASASDREAAAAMGISPALVSRTAWALAAGAATIAGVMLASGPAAATPNLGEVALRAFPAVILGGFVSLGGALAGGLVVGVVEVLTAGYLPGNELVVPYLVMLAVLLVRPEGLFVAPSARRL
jgi:branched-chain amino acid transport system permease protein